MSRIDDPQSLVTAGVQSPAPEGAPPDQRVFGLPWNDRYVLTLGADGSARVDSVSKPGRPDGTHVIAAPGGARAIRATTTSLYAAMQTATYRALAARDWALGHACDRCDDSKTFISKYLVLPRGPQWDQAIRTALIGDWTVPLEHGGRIGPEVVGNIKSDAKNIHRQLVPVWRRRVRGSRVMLLETPLGDNLTLRDLVAGELRMDDLVFETAFDDERVNAVLAGLDPTERRVAMAWAHPSIANWTEAACSAGVVSPEAYGERVRRKLKRLGARYATRARAVTVSRNSVLGPTN
ncbi:hypothetical protein OG548_42840 [Streptomyces sp. NBC_01356]|uniref:hypothetical protein n=1 Tax=Streptomyces sp. NBC_01356 TaxID=2903836 RepID=UPI002E2FD5BD|nr:hypothetical protein [Streptomyces sp. NBC_01356]